MQQTWAQVACGMKLQAFGLWVLAQFAHGGRIQNFQSPQSSNASAAKEWWDNKASPDFQHLDRDYVQQHEGEWSAFLPRFHWAGKAVLDYGIGAGYLGEKLLKPPYSIGAYYGVDISQKALKSASHVLSPWSKQVHLYLTPQIFSNLRPSIFVSQQVIQHFPSIQYFKEFLANVDASGAQELMLHFRASENGQTYHTDAYKKNSDKRFALVTSAGFLQAHLPHYALHWSDFRPMCCNTKGQYTGWALKKA